MSLYSAAFYTRCLDGLPSEREAELLKKIGELTVERDFLSRGLALSGPGTQRAEIGRAIGEIVGGFTFVAGMSGHDASEMCGDSVTRSACPSPRCACYRSAVSSTRIHHHVNAPRASVYRALLDPRAVATWKVPTGMTSHVHSFDAREGGAFRISLTYDAPTATGKTTAHTDTYHGHFAKLVPDEQVVEVVEFETTNPALQGEMTITITLADADGGTDVVAVHDGLPPGVSAADNELGWRISLTKLAALVEAG